MKLKQMIVLILIFLSSANIYAGARLGGDIRFRNDRQDKDDSDARYRQRIRGRIAIQGKVDENAEYHLRLTTGSSDPVSGNQSLDTGFSSKGIFFDIASLAYNFQNLPLKITAGKMKNPMFRPGKTELLWDGDLTPEGINLNLKMGAFFINGSYFVAEERSSGTDTNLHAIQLGMRLDNEIWFLKTALSFFDYVGLEGENVLYESDNNFGNTSITNGSDEQYEHDYELLELALQLDLKAIHLSFFVDTVVNTTISSNDRGYLAGFSYGQKLKLKYNYRKIEIDSTVGAFTDSDFKGGGTDGKGHELGVGYKLGKKQKISFSHFLNKTAVENGKDFNRSFLDYSLKF